MPGEKKYLPQRRQTAAETKIFLRNLKKCLFVPYIVKIFL